MEAQRFQLLSDEHLERLCDKSHNKKTVRSNRVATHTGKTGKYLKILEKKIAGGNTGQNESR